MSHPDRPPGPPGSPSTTATLSGARPSRQRRTWTANDGSQVAKKADTSRRFLAFAIDAVLVIALTLLPYVGGLLAGLYVLLRDGLDVAFFDRRSVGKRLARLRPLRDDGAPMDLATSARRNALLAITSFSLFLGPVPILGPVIRPIGTAVGIVLVLLEGYLALTDLTGLRPGDHLARTRVIDADA